MLRKLLGRRDETAATVESDLLTDVARDVDEIWRQRQSASGWVYGNEMREWPAAQRLLGRDRDQQPDVVLALIKLKRTRDDANYYHWTVEELVGLLLRRSLPWTEDQLVALLDEVVRASDDAQRQRSYHGGPYVRADALTGRVTALARYAADHELSDALKDRMRAIAERLRVVDGADERRLITRLSELLGDVRADGPLGASHDPWTQALRDYWDALEPERRSILGEVLGLAATARSSKMPAAFRASARELCARHGDAAVGELAGELLSAASRVPGDRDRGVIPPDTGEKLRGLAWLAGTAGGPAAACGLGDIALAGWKKVPSYGPLSRKAADAAIGALALIPDGAAQLGRLRALVKQPAAVASVDAAIDRAAAALGLDRDAFEELVAPDFGLTNGVRRVDVGEHTAELFLDDRFTARLRFRSGENALKSVPAAVRNDHKPELAELRATVKDLQAMVRAQRNRLERLLLSDRDWEFAEWQQRYADHGLVGALARRLIWAIDGTPTLWLDGTFVTAHGEPLPLPHAGARVSLWHPVDAPEDEVRAWRVFLEESELRQPFKQAHRELYLLTDAERHTRSYSNRFAAHVLKQHQMAALARERSWRYALQGAWDSPEEQASLHLPEFGLEVEFYVDRPHDWDNLDDLITHETGVFLYVLTDQVRFRRAGEPDPMALADVPPRVLSEVLRDVDLFVGVASVGNDPAWTDRGEARHFGDYWNEYSFGTLGAQGQNRADLLGRLLPKLAIADRCELDGRFLRVRGDLRTYKIHLGSTNILMEPDDQYLCIVPGRSDRGPDQADKVFLPFEGDGGLALILSKSFLLANDTAIKDPTIISQIRHRG